MTRREDEGETTKPLFFVSCRRVLAALETRFERHTLVCGVVRLYFRKTRLFSSHEPSPAKHSQNIPKTFSKRTVGHVAFRVRWRSIIGLAHERKRRSIDGSRFGTFFASTHILRPRRAFRQPTFFRRVRWTFSTASTFRFVIPHPRARASPPCPTPTPSSTPNMCIAETRTARVAPKQRAARHEHAPAPAFAVVAPAKRFDATEHDARCVRARYASPTRERDPDERDAREPPRRDAQTASLPTAAADRAAIVALATPRGAVSGARVRRRFVFFRSAQQPIATRRAPETARARAVTTARAPRGRRRHSNVRGDATRARRRARVRAPPPLRHDARPRDDTRLTRAPLFRREPPFAREKTDAPPTRFWRARASRPRARASAAAARCRFSVTPPAFA